jgi:hypothetical protein
MSWLMPSIDKRIERIQDQIDDLLIDDAGVTAEHETLRKIVNSGNKIPLYMVEDVAKLSSKYAKLAQQIKILQSKRDGLVAQKQMKNTLKGLNGK